MPYDQFRSDAATAPLDGTRKVMIPFIRPAGRGKDSRPFMPKACLINAILGLSLRKSWLKPLSARAGALCYASLGTGGSRRHFSLAANLRGTFLHD